MSQYIFIRGSKKYVFGWDQPLQSYFLQVHDVALPPDERVVTWLGADAATEMYEVEQLLEVASEHGLDIPHRIESELYEDKVNGR